MNVRQSLLLLFFASVWSRVMLCWHLASPGRMLSFGFNRIPKRLTKPSPNPCSPHSVAVEEVKPIRHNTYKESPLFTASPSCGKLVRASEPKFIARVKALPTSIGSSRLCWSSGVTGRLALFKVRLRGQSWATWMGWV